MTIDTSRPQLIVEYSAVPKLVVIMNNGTGNLLLGVGYNTFDLLKNKEAFVLAAGGSLTLNLCNGPVWALADTVSIDTRVIQWAVHMFGENLLSLLSQSQSQ